MRSIKSICIIIFIVIIALFLPVTINYILYVPSTYIGGNSVAGGILLTILFYALQVGIPIALGSFILHKPLREMGFNRRNLGVTLKFLAWFVPIWSSLVILFYAIGLTYITDFDIFVSRYFVKDNSVMLRQIVTGSLLAGIGEEPLFRGFVVTFLLTVISGTAFGKFKIPLVAIITGILFGLAHTKYQVVPFRIIQFDGVQFGITFILGTLWSVIFIKTKSLLGPIIAHMSANIIQIMSGYFIAYYIL